MNIIKKLFGISKPYALPMDFMARPGDYTWEMWEADAKKAHPSRYFMSETMPTWFRIYLGRLGRTWYWVKSHTYKKQHLLDMRSPEYPYDYGYADPVSLMIIAPFRILQDFVEKEKPFERINWDSDPGHIHAASEIKDLYRWWMIGRGEEQKRLDALQTEWYAKRLAPEGNLLFEELNKMEQDLNDKDTEQTVRLIKIRNYLWT